MRSTEKLIANLAQDATPVKLALHPFLLGAKWLAGAVDDVLHSIYRPMQATASKAMRLTFSLDLLLFRVK